MEILADIRSAVAAARWHKGFVVACIVILALSTGATTAVFSVVHGVLIMPLPYPAADRIVRLYEERPGAVAPLRDRLLSNVTYDAWAERPDSTLASMAAYSSREYTVGFHDDSARVLGAAVSPSLQSVLRAAPAVGRFFDANDAKTGAQSVVILSDRVWRQQFGADPHAVGRLLSVDGLPRLIVGVMRPDFYFPDRRALLWTPYAVPPPPKDNTSRKVSTLLAVGRLKDGMTPAYAGAEGTAVARNVASQSVEAELLFGTGGPPTVHADTLVQEMTSRVRPALIVIAASALLVLFIGCLNLANLLLSRATTRRQELAVRAALGASRLRLARQQLAESLVIGIPGGLLGLVLAWTLVEVSVGYAPADFPRLPDIQVDVQVAAFALVTAIVAAMTASLVPLLLRHAADMFTSLQGASVGRVIGASGGRLRDGLLVAEAALAVVLLVGASSLERSFRQLVERDVGYIAANVLTARIYVPSSARSPQRPQEILEALLVRLRDVPSVVAAGGGNMMPLGESTFLSAFDMPSQNTGKPMVARALEYAVTPGYAEALGLRLLDGRLFNERDAGAARSEVIVNEEFARQYLAAGPIPGRLYATGLGSSAKEAEIIGVVANVLKDGFSARPQPEIYLMLQNGGMREINVVARTQGDPMMLAPTVRQLVKEIEPTAAVGSLTPLTQLVSASVAQPRLATTVFVVFTLLAVTLASLGQYSVLSYTVSLRRRELGVRAALGADRASLMRLVLRHGLMTTAAGLLLGGSAAMPLMRLTRSVLVDVLPASGVDFARAPLFLLPVALIACLRPALKAAKTDPVEALRLV